MDPYRVGRFTVDRNQRLGGGAFGQVYVAVDSRGQTVAAKEIWVGNLDPDHKRRVELEIAAHRNIAPHPNIIRYVDSVTKGPYTWLFTEKCKDGNLDEFFSKNDVTLAQKFDLLLQITRGVHHLHHLEPPHVHRDLKPLNILVQSDEDKLTAVLADFGFVKALERSSGVTVPMETVCGSDFYMAPEIYEVQTTGSITYTKKVDIFSLGLIFFACLDAKPKQPLCPLKVDKKALGLVMHQNSDQQGWTTVPVPIHKTDSLPEKLLKTLIISMLHPDPEARPAIDSVLSTLLDIIRKHFPSSSPAAQASARRLDDHHAAETRIVASLSIRVFPAKHYASPSTDPQASARRLDDQLAARLAATRLLAPPLTARVAAHGQATTESARPKVTSSDPRRRATGENPERPRHARRYAEARRTVRRLTLTIIGGLTDTDGGFDDTVSTSCWRQTTASSSGWLQFTSLPQKLDVPAVCATSRGLFLSGGWEGKRQVRTCHLFEPGTGRWRQLADMPTARDAAAAVTMGDMVVVLGGAVGSKKHNNLQILGNVEAFDFNSNSWVVLKQMKQKMAHPICTVINSQIHALFNNDQVVNKAVQRGAEISLQRYDSGSDRWSFGPSLPRGFGRTWGARAVAVGSTMLVAGHDICASYDTDTQTWSKLSPCLHEHNYGSLVVSAGRVILAGGEWKGKVTDVIEEYDVGRNRWAECGTRLPRPLWTHHAVMLDLSDMSS